MSLSEKLMVLKTFLVDNGIIGFKRIDIFLICNTIV